MPESALRVLVDLTHLYPAGLSGGIKPALLEMLRWLAAQPEPAMHFIYVVSASSHTEVAAMARPVDRLIPAGQLPRDLAARECCDVVYCPFGSTDLGCPGIPVLTLIVDLLHRDFPASISAEELALRERWFDTAILRTDCFQVISAFTARQLAAHYGVPPARMFTSYLPLHQRFARLPPPPAAVPGRPYFYYPANAWVHKNHECLLHAYAAYRQSAGTSTWPLVLTGADNASMGNVRALAARLNLCREVSFLGYVDEERLPGLWAGAGALVFPSLYEGFGIPLLEAMAHGVPIIANRAGSIPEITGDAALLLDARDSAMLAGAMERVASDASLRQALAAAGRRQLQMFSPDHEFGALQQALVATARRRAQWLRTGYHAIDGLTDPEAVFALPRPLRAGTLGVKLRALPVSRTVQVWSSRDLIGEKFMRAAMPAEFTLDFTPRSAALTLRIPDAGNLSVSDPRTHGVLLEALSWHDARGAADLLSQSNTV